jgi:hypothetical protein
MGLTWIKIINKPGITLKWQKHAIIWCRIIFSFYNSQSIVEATVPKSR